MNYALFGGRLSNWLCYSRPRCTLSVVQIKLIPLSVKKRVYVMSMIVDMNNLWNSFETPELIVQRPATVLAS